MRAGFEEEKVAIPSLLPNKLALVSNGRKRVTYNEGGDWDNKTAAAAGIALASDRRLRRRRRWR